MGRALKYSVLMRNLGLYAWRVKNDLPDAAPFYEKAVKLAPEDYRLYADLDEIYFRMGSAGRREKLFAGRARFGSRSGYGAACAGRCC